MAYQILGKPPLPYVPFLRRLFTTSSRCSYPAARMREEDLCGLKINQDRLMSNIHYTCQWGTGERWGPYVYRSSTPYIRPIGSAPF
jgi:hypothetical protein